ncbi:unnamed protein product [Urochloa humidicola]
MGYAASLVAPELPEMGPRYPDWIFLKNATVADNHTSDGHPIQVSLFAATPPAVSHLCVHCPGREDQFTYNNPAVIFSWDDLILFDVSFGIGDTGNYFICKADSKAPRSCGSRIRSPTPQACSTRGSCAAARTTSRWLLSPGTT